MSEEFNNVANEVKAEVEKNKSSALKRVGLEAQYNMWRESLPPGALSDRESYETFLNSAQVERAAQDGRVSVATGGEENVLAVDTPTPGPDGEETGPDEAGDTSEGGEEDPGGLKLVEGMWQPPEESEALNYEEPSTYEMTQSDEWLENARAFYKFMGSPNTANERAALTKEFGSQAFAPPQLMSTAAEAEPMSDDEIRAWTRNQLSSFNWNLANTMSIGQKIMSSNDPKAALAFLNLVNMYDHSDGGAMDFVGAVGEMGTDPTTYAGLGVGGLAAKGAAKATAKAGLKKAIQIAIVGGTAGGVEGGMVAGGFDLTVQNIEQEAGARKDLDYGQAGKSTAMGVGFGVTLGGGGGHLVGRKMDKIASLHEEQMARLLGGQEVEAARRKDLGIDDFVSMLRESDAATAKAGQADQAALLARRYVMEKGDIPKTPDGDIDTEQVALELIEMQKRSKTTGREAKTLAESAIDRGESIESVGTDPATLDDLVTYVHEIRKEEGLSHDLAEEAIRMLKDSEQPAGRGVTGDEALARIDQADAPKPLSKAESEQFAERIAEMHARQEDAVVPRTPGFPGSKVKTIDGVMHEVMGRTKNGWYHLRSAKGIESNQRRAGFEVMEAQPGPAMAGPMELKPFTKSAGKIIAMNEQILTNPNRLKEINITHKEQQALADELVEMGIDITNKNIATHWSPHELMALRDAYNSQANGMAALARRMEGDLRNNGRLNDEQLAMFNEAHTQFVATRDLFFGTSGNAARQLNILRSRPKDTVYEFSSSLMDSISLQGGRANTERAITLMSKFAREAGEEGGAVKGISKLSDTIWGNQYASAMLNVRYNLMLSSWRTHFFNFLGNSASGVYQHLMVSPVRMGINNINYARQVAQSIIDPKFAPDPADRMTRHQYFAELRGHYAGFRDSLYLAKEIALGRDIGEGKVWNELGLRYNVINQPESMGGKIGTTPVRMLEAGDAFFKNQYYNSKMHELSSIKARYDEIYNGADYKTAYDKYLADPDAPMQREAQAFAAKQTYTNDPNVYGGVLAALAKGAAEAQNRSVMVNMIVPFVRTPANLLSYSMETIGANVLLSPNKTYDAIMKGTQRESQEALARLTVAGGLWLAVGEAYQNGDITGTGPSNWEERKVWEAAGWQPNSVKIHGKWVSIERAAPGGQSLATIASVYDFYAMTQQQKKDVPAWVGAGMLYTADMILDESYISSAADVLAAISSKSESKSRSVTASTINSLWVPNLLRDLRRPADATMRSSTSTNLITQVVKQAKNASPWHSDELPPQRDWRGEPKQYYGNAYHRGLIPFNVRDPSKSDPASMALAYARIPVSTPDKTMVFSSITDDKIDFFAMDNGGGFVYDKYLEIMGQARANAVNEVIGTAEWRALVRQGDIGPGSTGERVLRAAMSIGTKGGRLEMMDFLITHSGDNNTFQVDRGRDMPSLIHIQHQVSPEEYIRARSIIRGETTAIEGEETEFDQYIINKPVEGPDFFRPQ